MAQGFTRGTPIDTDPNLSLDSDLVVPSQKAIKDYVDTGLNTKQDTLTLTTTGTSGAATLIGATLNIPQYGGGSNSIGELTGDVTAGPATTPSEVVVSTLKTNLRVGSIVTILDGQGGVIQTGRGNNFLSIPFSGTITGWTVLSSVSGSIEVAFWKDTYANYPPTVADNIFSPNPSLTSTNKNQATGLSIAVAAGDIIIPNVVSVTTCTNVTISIQITRS
jgi:hypothetical protein